MKTKKRKKERIKSRFIVDSFCFPSFQKRTLTLIPIVLLAFLYTRSLLLCTHTGAPCMLRPSTDAANTHTNTTHAKRLGAATSVTITTTTTRRTRTRARRQHQPPQSSSRSARRRRRPDGARRGRGACAACARTRPASRGAASPGPAAAAWPLAARPRAERRPGSCVYVCVGACAQVKYVVIYEPASCCRCSLEELGGLTDGLASQS